jgi:hypothetical protein
MRFETEEAVLFCKKEPKNFCFVVGWVFLLGMLALGVRYQPIEPMGR